MKFLNTNTAHNALNVAITLLCALEVFDWSAFYSADTAVKIVGALSLAKLLINATRDGLTGMVKEQPPVEESK